MQVSAHLKRASIAAQKARLVADQIRGKSAESAVELLRFSNKKAAHLIKKVVDSAIANAEHNHGADIDELKVAAVYADQGSTFKRMHARAKGRGSRVVKPTCHITVILSDQENR